MRSIWPKVRFVLWMIGLLALVAVAVLVVIGHLVIPG
jgi:hypothetical protein